MAPDSGHYLPKNDFGPAFVKFFRIPEGVWRDFDDNDWPSWYRAKADIDNLLLDDVYDYNHDYNNMAYSQKSHVPASIARVHHKHGDRALSRHHATHERSEGTISDEYYHEYGSYDHYHPEYALSIAMTSIIFIGCCCMIIIVSIIGGFISGKFYEIRRNQNHEQYRYKYGIINANEDHV